MLDCDESLDCDDMLDGLDSDEEQIDSEESELALEGLDVLDSED